MSKRPRTDDKRMQPNPEAANLRDPEQRGDELERGKHDPVPGKRPPVGKKPGQDPTR